MNTKLHLMQLRDELQAALDDGEDAAKPVSLDQNKVGRLSRMDAMQQQAMQQAGQDAIKKRLVDVSHALQALESGDYGYCERCGNEISEERLRVRPEARFCVSCQQVQEEV